MLGINAGSAHRIVEHRKDFIKYYQNLGLDFDGFEVTTIRDEIESLMTEKKYLKNKQISIHLMENDICESITMAQTADVKYYVLHPTIFYVNEQLEKKILIENLDKAFIQKNYMFDLLSYYDINFDISHSLSYSFENFVREIELYKNKIKRFHISNYNEDDYREHKCHVPFFSDKKNRLKDVISVIEDNGLNDLPFIMEYNFESKKELIEEYSFIKEFI